jgi:3-methyladenine DNA glycosylase AlkC
MNPDQYLNRKGARSMADVPREVAEMLNLGWLSAVNLPEWLLVNHRVLVGNLFREGGFDKHLPAVLRALDDVKKPGVLQSIKSIGQMVTQLGDSDLVEFLSLHPSDSARSYAAIAVGTRPVSIDMKLQNILPYAADVHFGVREIAWLSVRPSVDESLNDSILILQSWSIHPDANVRRFASEVLRPRGVWCKHIQRLKDSPELALPVLNPLKSDKSKYVRDSVANHLNDASKSRPDFVRAICLSWAEESSTPETAYIIKRALRSL